MKAPHGGLHSECMLQHCLNDVACRYCGARRGKCCRTKFGGLAQRSHKVRTEAWFVWWQKKRLA